MNKDQKEKLINGTKSLLKSKTSPQVLKDSLPLFYPSPKRWVILLISGIVIFFFLYLFLFDFEKAIKVFEELVSDINEIIIPTFAVLITGYAIFQALVSGPTLIVLIKLDKNNERTKFEIYNLYFFGISILYLFLMIFNLIMLLVFKHVSVDWTISTFKTEINECIAALLITVYLLFVLNALIELKSFIYNLYQIFINNAGSSAIELLNESKQNGEPKQDKYDE